MYQPYDLGESPQFIFSCTHMVITVNTLHGSDSTHYSQRCMFYYTYPGCLCRSCDKRPRFNQIEIEDLIFCLQLFKILEEENLLQITFSDNMVVCNKQSFKKVNGVIDTTEHIREVSEHGRETSEHCRETPSIVGKPRALSGNERGLRIHG